MNSWFNKKESIENTIKVNIYYQEHRESFQSSINLRTKPCIPHQSHGVPKDNPTVPNNLEYVQQ